MKLMKKKMLCIVSLLCIVLCMSAQNPYERKWNVVHVDRPGNLIPCIFKTIYARADNLEIHGEINGSDLAMLNLIMGGRSGIGGMTASPGSFPRTTYWEPTEFFLCPREIDLSDAHFKSGDWYGYFEDDFYGMYDWYHWLYLEEGVAGSSLFNGVDSLRRLVLPNDTKRVRYETFSDGYRDAYLEELVVPASVMYFNIHQFNVKRIVFKGTEPPMCTMWEYWEEDPDGVISEDIPITEAYYEANDWLRVCLEPVTLVVPEGCREKYRQTSIWRFAKQIIEEGEFTDVKAVEADGTAQKPSDDRRTFRLDGRLAQPGERGIVVHEGRKELKR